MWIHWHINIPGQEMTDYLTKANAILNGEKTPNFAKRHTRALWELSKIPPPVADKRKHFS